MKFLLWIMAVGNAISSVIWLVKQRADMFAVCLNFAWVLAYLAVTERRTRVL